MDQITGSETLRSDRPAAIGVGELLDRIAEGASDRDRERRLPYDMIDLIRQARLGAVRLNVEDGGTGSTQRELFGLIVSLGEADANVAHILRNHFSFVERYVRNNPNEKFGKWRKAVADGAIFGLAYGELETRAVGNWQVNTTLTPEAGGYRLNGTKYYSTGSLYADYVLVRAVTDDGTQASAVVPVDREGLELVDDWDGFGQRLTGTGTTYLRDVRVADDEVVFDSEGRFLVQPYVGAIPQLILTAINAGIVQATLRDAAALVRRRERSFFHASAERPADDPILQQAVGQIASTAFAAKAIVLAAADALDRLDATRDAGKPDFDATHEASLRASQAKVVVDELAIRAGSLLLDVGGASATKQSYNLDRHWRNARTLASHNPAAYKARAIGDHAINGTSLPVGGFF
jgi:alkylation response protein AidB-like acyl-CoA dehydrogenase